MDVIVQGKNVHVSERLRTAAERKLAKIDRLAHDTLRIEVDFSQLANPRIADNQICTVIVHLKRRVVTAKAAAPRAEAALDLVVAKVEQQVARIKDRRVDRSHPRRSRSGPEAGLPPNGDELDEDEGEDVAGDAGDDAP